MNYYNVCLALLILASCQPKTLDSALTEDNLVELKPVPRIELKKGVRNEVPLIFEIEPGYHIMADTGSTEQWVYTKMRLEADPGFLTDTPIFPAPEDLILADDTQPLYVFESELEVKVPILPSVQAEHGAYHLRGQLFYQACTKQKCFFPRGLDFQIQLQFGNQP